MHRFLLDSWGSWLYSNEDYIFQCLHVATKCDTRSKFRGSLTAIPWKSCSSPLGTSPFGDALGGEESYWPCGGGSLGLGFNSFYSSRTWKNPRVDGDCDNSTIFQTHAIERGKPSKAIVKTPVIIYEITSSAGLFSIFLSREMFVRRMQDNTRPPIQYRRLNTGQIISVTTPQSEYNSTTCKLKEFLLTF